MEDHPASWSFGSFEEGHGNRFVVLIPALSRDGQQVVPSQRFRIDQRQPIMPCSNHKCTFSCPCICNMHQGIDKSEGVICLYPLSRKTCTSQFLCYVREIISEIAENNIQRNQRHFACRRHCEPTLSSSIVHCSIPGAFRNIRIRRPHR